jgi:alpha-amylase
MRRWQTPAEGGPAYDPSFGTYRDLVGYADIQYNSARTAAAVVVNAASRTGETLKYSFNGGSATTSNVFQVDSSLSSSLAIAISTSSGKTLILDSINFIWQNAPLTAAQSSFQNGQKGGIAELFGWPWVDVGKECAFLGKAGYMGVKIWPPNEHVWGSNYVSNYLGLDVKTSMLIVYDSMNQTSSFGPGISCISLSATASILEVALEMNFEQ